MAFDTTPRNPDNIQYTDLGVTYSSSLSGIDTSKYYTILSFPGGYTFQGSTITGTYPGYALGIVNTTKDYSNLDIYFKVQSTNLYSQTTTIGGINLINAPGIGTNPTPGLVSITFNSSNVTMSIFSSTSSGINSSKYFNVQSTNLYSQTTTIGGINLINAPGIGTNPTPGLVNIQFNVPSVTMSIFSPTNIGYSKSRRPQKGLIVPRSRNVPIGVGTQQFCTSTVSGISTTSNIFVGNSTRQAHMIGNRPYYNQVFPN